MARSTWINLSRTILFGLALSLTAKAFSSEPPATSTHAPGIASISDSIPSSVAASADCFSGNCGATADCLSDCLPCNYFANNGWFVGAEYLYLRENMSEPVAAVRRTVINDGANSTILDETQAFDFDYNSSFRLNGGFRCGECCGEAINFSYFHYGSTAAYVPDPICSTICHIYAGQLGNNADGGGERFLATYDTNINSYDLEYSKRIPICSCNSDPCDCCQCPPWAVTWSAGVRVLDFSRREANAVFAAGGAVASTGEILTDFNGAGPKVSVDGRRYFGETRCWSFYSKGSLALLLGDYGARRTLVDGIAIGIQTDDYRRLIPMTEIEFGLSRQIGQKTFLTVGYFLQAYWDLGMFENIEGTNFGAQDDSNILSFDGLMVRVEHTF